MLIPDIIWVATLLPYYLPHHWAIMVGFVAGLFRTGLSGLPGIYDNRTSQFNIDKFRIEMNANLLPIRPQLAAGSVPP